MFTSSTEGRQFFLHILHFYNTLDVSSPKMRLDVDLVEVINKKR